MPKPKSDKAGYVVLRGISWPKEGGGWHNVEASKKPRRDLPPEYVAGWLEVGAIEPADDEEEA